MERKYHFSQAVIRITKTKQKDTEIYKKDKVTKKSCTHQLTGDENK